MDTDGDGLNDCEETLLGSDERKYDTDADGLPDAIEFNGGTSYLYDDRFGDLDNDGMTNGDEIATHLDPLFAEDTDARAFFGYRYNLDANGLAVGGFPCYDFEVTNIGLLDTLETHPDAGHGWNRIVAIIAEWPAAGGEPQHRIATVQVRRIEGQPTPDGVTLEDSNFLFVD
ncbi:MAG: hypothetical protein ABII82_14145 [Verrucomicrobiota bacterium]